MSTASEKWACPECGELTDRLCEGFCETCWEYRQAMLDFHNLQFDRWQKLSSSDRESEIKWASR